MKFLNHPNNSLYFLAADISVMLDCGAIPAGLTGDCDIDEVSLGGDTGGTLGGFDDTETGGDGADTLGGSCDIGLSDLGSGGAKGGDFGIFDVWDCFKGIFRGWFAGRGAIGGGGIFRG